MEQYGWVEGQAAGRAAVLPGTGGHHTRSVHNAIAHYHHTCSHTQTGPTKSLFENGKIWNFGKWLEQVVDYTV